MDLLRLGGVVPNNRKIGELPRQISVEGEDWYRTSRPTRTGCYCWAKADSLSGVDRLFQGSYPPHFTVTQVSSGWVKDIHFSDRTARIYFFQPKTRYREASSGWGANVPHSNPWRSEEDSLKRMFRDFLAGCRIDDQGLLPTATLPAVEPVTAPDFSSADDFPALGS